MTYVDGFVAAVPSHQKDVYRQHAETAARFFKRHGALSVIECWGDDVPEGEVNSFHTAVMKKPDETVVFSWIVWPDKAARDTGNARVFEDMKAAGEEMTDMPFDGKRLIFGGFEVLFEA